MLLEQLLNLLETPLPTDLQGFEGEKTREKAGELGYKRLGHGSSRDVYKTKGEILKSGKTSPRHLATKFASSEHRMLATGIAQNKEEINNLLQNYMNISNKGDVRVLIPLVDYDKSPKGPLWIQTRLAKPFDEEVFGKFMGMSFYDFYSYLGFWQYNGIPDNSEIDSDRATGVGYLSKFSNNGIKFIKKLTTIVRMFDIKVSDLANRKNWGIYKGKPVIIDFGLTGNTTKYY